MFWREQSSQYLLVKSLKVNANDPSLEVYIQDWDSKVLSHVVPMVHLFFFPLKRPKSFVGAFGVSTNDQDNVASGNEFHASAVTALRIAC